MRSSLQCPRLSPFAALALAVSLPAQTWLNAAPATAPAARRFHTMAFEDARARTLLFGGSDVAGTLLGDTWAFDGANWSALAPAVSPPARRYHAMVHDRGRARTVLFGGADNATALGDTWEHDGSTWIQVSTANAPAPRMLTGLAYDAVRRKVVLFGGADAFSAAFGDTWEYDGADWTQVVTATAPGARDRHAMVYDSARARVVLFGGVGRLPGGLLGTYLGDTWEYDGSAWVPVPVAGPPPRTLHAAVYDPVGARTLVYGGQGVTVVDGHGGGSTTPIYADTWAFDGAAWTPVAGSPVPAGRYAHAMSSGGTAANAVLFGGSVGFGGSPSGDTWRLLPAAAATWSRQGVGCASGASAPQLDAAPASLPVLGSTFTLQLSSLPPVPGMTVLALGTELGQWHGAPLPLPVDPLRPGCQLWVAPAVNVLLLHTGSTAQAAITIPTNPALAGLVLGAQALSVEPPGSSPAWFALGNSGLMRLH